MTRIQRNLLSILAALGTLLVPVVCVSAQDNAQPGERIWLETLDLTKMTVGWGEATAGRSIVGERLTLKGNVFEHGVGSHADSSFEIDLKGNAQRFEATVGVDDETEGKGSVVFEVWVDDKLAAESGVLRGNGTPKTLSVDLSGAKSLALIVTDAGDGRNFDHADWANAAIVLKPGATARPEVLVSAPEEDKPDPPIASGTPPEPAIHGPRVVGTTPGRPFLFLIPATGEGPLAFSAPGLPEGLSLDTATGIISGSLKEEGTTDVTLSVKGPKGEAQRTLTIVGGKDKLARTPPMGWNSWYVWGVIVDDAMVRAAADWMVKTGLAAHGYQYVNIDDCWEGDRGPDGQILTNKRFPDMKALGNYIHSKGLKFGIYTSPGPKTCAGYTGSYEHELDDAMTYAEWGVDFVKHDWCSYAEIAKDESRQELEKPYRIMKEAIEATGRDMVYSLCQYGMGNVWEWGAGVGGNLWRTTGDSGDTWSVMSSIGFSQNGLEKYAGPGHWNDPDMIQAGMLGMGIDPRPTQLTQNEQITQMTLWSILAAPLLLSCDLSKLDAFTIDLFTNDEVIDVNQDPLGKQGGRIAMDRRTEVWARPLTDGTTAVGLFNRGSRKTAVAAQWADLGIKGQQPVRDLWRKRNLGEFGNAFSAEVPRHGAMMLKIGKPAR